MGWAGVVFCEVLEVDAPNYLRYSWKGDEASHDITEVTYTLAPMPGGTRFTWHHAGFTGLGGLAMSTLLGNVRRKMLDEGLPPVLAAYHQSHAA